MSRITAAFDQARSQGRGVLVVYITAGDPNLDVTRELVRVIDEAGADIIELGMPYSDPIADGPTIQASYTEALAAGVTSQAVLEMVRRWRAGGAKLALVAMVSYSIVFCRGPEEYLRSAAEAGFDGLIIPDLPLEEAGVLEPLAAANALANVMLIAPTTPPRRRLEIARHSRGFIYFISVAGITGERERLPESTIQAVGELRRHTDTPVCVGFGISNPRMVATVCEVADGAIVGSAIVRRISQHKDLPADQLAAKVGQFVGELLEPIA